MARHSFPDGWEIVGLFSESRGIREVTHNTVRSRDIIRADAIIVRHTNPDNGVVSHRTIHGALDKEQVGTLIDTQVAHPAGSPPGTRSGDK